MSPEGAKIVVLPTEGLLAGERVAFEHGANAASWLHQIASPRDIPDEDKPNEATQKFVDRLRSASVR